MDAKQFSIALTGIVLLANIALAFVGIPSTLTCSLNAGIQAAHAMVIEATTP